MKSRQKLLLTMIVGITLGLGLGYFIGYDNGFEKAISQSKEVVTACDLDAQKKAREDMRGRYGDPVSIELLISSPYYHKHYSQCLNEKIR